MSKSDTFENDLLKLIFWGTPIANLADNAVASPLTNLYLSLHSADPGEAGNQSTNEVTYTGYARVALARSAAAWAISGNVVNPVANIDFPEVTAGTGSATHVAIGTAASGAGKILYRLALSSAIAIAVGNVPRAKTTSSVTED